MLLVIPSLSIKYITPICVLIDLEVYQNFTFDDIHHSTSLLSLIT